MYQGWSDIKGRGGTGPTDLAGFLLKLDNSGMNMKVQKSSLVEKELKVNWIEFGQWQTRYQYLSFTHSEIILFHKYSCPLQKYLKMLINIGK